MRRWLLFVVLAAVTLPAFAAKQVTVQQLNQLLASVHGKSDAETATRLSDLELTERPSGSVLSGWQTSLPGPKSQQALALLADAATFLNLPGAEIPSKAAPDHDAQRQMLALTVSYISRTVHQLPNLFATRSTASFEDTPQGYENGGMVFVPAKPLHSSGHSSVTVVYRDGAEVHEASLTKASKTQAASHGLTSAGEFGPILATVLVDAAHGTLGWGHWEPGASGPAAVFRYAVLQEKSHYEVSYCCVSEHGGDGYETAPFHQIVGYHGEMTIDPTTGAVLRLTAQADLKPVDPLVRADIAVEFGPVEIGGKSYICPLRSVAISEGHALQAAEQGQFRTASGAQTMQYAAGHLQTLLNEVSFTQYHLFTASAQIMTADAGSSDAQPPSASGSTTSAPDTTTASTTVPPPTAAAPPEPTANNSTSEAAAPISPSPAPAASPAEASTTTTASSSTSVEPDFTVPALNPTNPQKVPVFKAKSEAVVVDVVVTKGRDEPVLGLNKQDFQVMEDGKPQSVDLFEEHSSMAQPTASPTPMPPHVFTNEPVAPQGDSVNVLLLDSLNTDKEDQNFVHRQILAFLKGMQPNIQVAVFLLTSNLRLIHGFTNDASVLQDALNDKQNGVSPTRTAASRSLQDKLDDQNEVANMSAIQMSPIGIEALQNAQANVAAYQADQRVSMTLNAMNYIARYLAAIPGRKNLIWFSGSFPISVFPSSKEKLSPDAMREYGGAIKQTAGLLTLSKVAVYPVGAEGLINEHPMEATNFTPTTTEGATADGRMPGATSQRQGDPMQPYSDEHSARASKIAAMEQLAADTGGEAIFNTNDLNKAIARAINDGSHYYTLVYTPANKTMDGKYRRVEVKVNPGKYKLAYRRGYYAEDPAQTSPSPSIEDKAGDQISDEANGQPDPLRPLLVRGLPSATQLLYGVRVLPAATQPAANSQPAGGNDKLTGPLTRYSIDFMIRWTDVDLQATSQGTQRGQLQLDLIAYGRDGKPVNWVSTTQRMNLDAKTFAAIQRSGIPAHVEIDLPQQNVYLATGVYDWASKRAGTLEVPVKFPDPQAASASPGPATTNPN